MKNVKTKLTSLMAAAIVLVVMVACQKDAVSGPNFIFKAKPSTEAVATILGQTISEKEFNAGIESELYEAEMKVYEIKMNRLKAMALERLMKEDKTKGAMTNDEFLEKVIAKNIKVSDKDIDKFIADRQIPKEQVTPEVRDRIVEFLKADLTRVAIDNWMAEKTKSNPIDIYFQKPILPSFDVKVGNAPIKGNKNAKVTIVEYSDFQCPFCSKGATLLKDIEKKYGNKVQIAFKHYPLPFHSQAKLAAEASMCANEQSVNLFWKMHDEMFADQSKLDKDNLIAKARKIGAKLPEFEKCLNSGKFTAAVEADVAEGQAIGVKSTPTFFVNGKLVAGAQPLEVFSEIIDSELK